MNDDVEFYKDNNKLQQRDCRKCLEEYGKDIKWRNGDKVLDIGCGDGCVTTKVIKKFMPVDFGALIGSDISNAMVKYANKHYKDERTSFSGLDIEGEIPLEWKNNFNHVFSCYALNWVMNQEKCFQNIYDLLTDDGDCLVIFLAKMVTYDAYRALVRKPKWYNYLKDLDKRISPYYDLENPELELERILKKSGFRDINVKCLKKDYDYGNIPTLKDAFLSVDPFKIPSELAEDYMNDYVEALNKLKLIHSVNGTGAKVFYSLLVGFGRK